MVSVGVNSDAGLVGSITVDEQNFDWTRLPTSWEDIRDGVAWRGNGERLQIQLVPGTEIQRYSITWQNPNLMDSDVGLGLNGYYFQREYNDWFETWMGGRASLGYQLRRSSPAASPTASRRSTSTTWTRWRRRAACRSPSCGRPWDITTTSTGSASR